MLTVTYVTIVINFLSSIYFIDIEYILALEKVEAGGSEVQGQSQLHSESKPLCILKCIDMRLVCLIYYQFE